MISIANYQFYCSQLVSRMIILLLLTALSLSYALQTPERQLGHLLMGNRTSDVFIDAFFDNICSDCAADWPMFSKVISQDYLKNRLGVAVHIFPLPYHHNSFFAAWAGETIMHTNTSKYTNYMTYIFQHYDDFITGAVGLTEPQVKQKYAIAAETSTGIKAQVILNGYRNIQFDTRARQAWKYACYRDVSGTPTFFVNDVAVPEASGFDMEQWNSFLGKILG
ncbi:hypothetical protein LOD99_2019 [Oopsacas minuta]|uniref:Thioredoxin-like fold domain-containing protein n=1 Tax=Oopsacas minuta TaxID=111878 RepID=A0AAV7K3Z1_9METZ|nr:hypothetical protein LOD99_2019 [Oopsacas minuta]